MSKKPKVSRHRVPALAMTSDLVDADYQSEVDSSIDKLERRYQKAQKALEAAEAKAERARIHAQQLAEKQRDAELVAANRLANESQLSEYIDRIKIAAKESRVAEAREQLERKHRDAVARRNAETVKRKTEAKALREREHLIRQSKSTYAALERAVAERRREVREIELLMMPGNYAGRDHRKRGAQHYTNDRISRL
jgi:hypothetical protein